MLQSSTFGNTQSKSGSAGFVGYEWIKQCRQKFVRNADTVVADVDLKLVMKNGGSQNDLTVIYMRCDCI